MNLPVYGIWSLSQVVNHKAMHILFVMHCKLITYLNSTVSHCHTKLIVTCHKNLIFLQSQEGINPLIYFELSCCGLLWQVWLLHMNSIMFITTDPSSLVVFYTTTMPI